MSGLEFTWFVLCAGSLAAYVVLDGFDLGAGVLHLFVAKDDRERRVVLRSIGPVWDGNEVWLIAAAATIFMAFPPLFARSFAGFYLPLNIVLWLLVFRALGIELRHQMDHPLWNQAWDVAFAAASVLLTFGYGAALGNVLRGVSIGEDGTFFAPLWTTFDLSEPVGVLDGYTVIIGVGAVVVLALHGATWLVARTEGAVHERAAAWLPRLWGATLLALVVMTAATWFVQPQLATNLVDRPLGIVLPVIAVASLVSVLVLRRERPRWAFRASCAFVGALVCSAGYAIFPMVLPARDPAHSLLAAEVAADEYALRVALWWWIPGMLLASSYFVFLYRKMPATFAPDDDDAH